MGRQAEANAFVPLPMREGVSPSYLWLQDGPWTHLLPFLVENFPLVSEASWRARLARGEVVDGQGRALRADSRYQRGMRIWYYRELEAETPIPFTHTVLHEDAHLLVVDKPHFLPTIPTGRFLHETLLVRLKKATGNPDLVPIHRLDRETAGVVIFSTNRTTRGIYQSMFQQRVIGKEYEALAPLMAERSFPFTYRSRLDIGDKFFVMKEVAGAPNAESEIDLIETRGGLGRYRLLPHTGRQHQLRVHMAALGAPILNDAFYPVALPCKGDDVSAPLQLLARAVRFTDPLTGAPRCFTSARRLDWPAA
ncbi:RluA family pseudouridine synthase [Massilia sp. TS11]|uniref:RluA family pseudouridine synthase n=1 Tax=Massilia sp. TS11 TaxID=2908003 RepID=UPI001EDA04D5|nr:RluA family pseudouridine synthase [Massilia sp. TS11]MCG2585494.1 RluA family pseudouridine synthase [Massilia sp. TS11]